MKDSDKKISENFADSKKQRTFALAFAKQPCGASANDGEIAQLVRASDS